MLPQVYEKFVRTGKVELIYLEIVKGVPPFEELAKKLTALLASE